MGRDVRRTAWIVFLCLTGALAGPAGAAQAPQPKPAVAAQSQAARIWYDQRHQSHLVLPDGRPEIVRSMLNITKPMRFGDFVWDDKNIPGGAIWIRVDLGQQLLSVFRGGHEIGTAVILFGTDGKVTPTGSFTILEKDADHYSRSYDAPMPFMLRLTNDGVAIHGSNVRKGWATHGCIGVPLDFARLLFAAARKGDPVAILPLPARTAPPAPQIR